MDAAQETPGGTEFGASHCVAFGHFRHARYHSSMANPSSTLLNILKGESSPAQLLSSLYDTVEVRTNFTPPLRVDITSALDDSPTGPLVRLMQPTVIFSGNYGRSVVAPAGEAGNGTLVTFGIVAALIGLGYAIGRYSKR